MSMVKPAYPVLDPGAALAGSLVWAALLADDGVGNVRGGGAADTAFADLVTGDAYSFIDFGSGEGLAASPDRVDSGVRVASNSWADLATRLGGVSFELPGATGGSTSDHWMLALRVRSVGNGAIIHKGVDNNTNDLYVATLGGIQLQIRVSGTTFSANIGNAPFEDAAPFLDGSKDMTLVIASAGSGRFKVTWTGHGVQWLGSVGPASAELQDPSGNNFRARLGSRGTTNDADNPGVGYLHPDLLLYSAQVFRRATVFSEAEMVSLAENTYQCFRESPHPLSVSEQAQKALDFDRPFCWFGDSQSIENVNRLPQAVKEKYVPVENATSMFFSTGCQSLTVGSSRTLSSPSGMTWPGAPSQAGISGLVASLDGLLCNSVARGAFTGNVADADEVFNLLLWNSAGMFAGTAIWTQGRELEAVLLYAGGTGMTAPSSLQLRTRRGTVEDAVFAPDYTTAGLKSQQLSVPFFAASAQTFISIRAAVGVDETGADLVVVGGYFFTPDGSGGRADGYGWDTIAFGGFDAADWLALAGPLAFADRWAQTVIPEQINVMLGHNQASGHTTQLDAGGLTGDYTDDITALVDRLIEGASAARHQTLDFTTRTGIVLTTPWRSIAGASPMDDPVNAQAVESVHAALAAQRRFVHVSLYSEFGGENPLAAGLHPGDGAGDPATERELVADGWVSQLQGLLGDPPVTPVSLVQSKVYNSGGSTVSGATATFDDDPVEGNLLLADHSSISTSASGRQAQMVSAGWTPLYNPEMTLTTQNMAGWWYKFAGASEPRAVETRNWLVVPGSPANMQTELAIYEFSGVGAFSAKALDESLRDTFSTTASTGTTDSQSGGRVAFAMFSMSSAAGAPGALSYSNDFEEQGVSPEISTPGRPTTALAMRVLNASGALESTATAENADRAKWNGCIAVFEADAEETVFSDYLTSQIDTLGRLAVNFRYGLTDEFSVPESEHTIDLTKLTVIVDGNPVALSGGEAFHSVNNNAVQIADIATSPPIYQGQTVNIIGEAGFHIDANGVTSEAFEELAITNGSEIEEPGPPPPPPEGDGPLRTRPAIGGAVLRTRERMGWVG